MSKSFEYVHRFYRAARHDVATSYRRLPGWRQGRRRERDALNACRDLLSANAQFDRAVSARFHWYLKRYGIAVES